MIFFKLTIGYILDLISAIPPGSYHPIRLIGKMIAAGEKMTRRLFPKTGGGQVAAGGVMAAGVVLLSFFIPWGILWLCEKVHTGLAFVVETFWIYEILAGRCLQTEARKVMAALKKGDIKKSRKLLSYLVGRDTKQLDEGEIIKATGKQWRKILPTGLSLLLFLSPSAVPPLGFAYKAINTMDSMTGL